MTIPTLNWLACRTVVDDSACTFVQGLDLNRAIDFVRNLRANLMGSAGIDSVLPTP